MISVRTDILTDLQLKRLNEHKYSAYGDTLLDPYMQKFWKWIVQKFPTWFAPNLMTIIGLIVNAFTTLILIYYSPDAKAAVPAWTLILFAIGLFVYQTLDACDGKQARRTGSTSTLGELFDHGCDSLSTVFVAISACIAVQLGEYPNLMFYQCTAASALFYAAHWQTYVSAKLRFGKFDVTEAQFCIIVIHIISAIFGVEIWSKQVPYVNCSLKILTICMIFLGEINQFLSYFRIIFAGGVGKNGSTVAGTSVLSPCIPITILITSAVIIFMKSTTNLVQQNPCLYLLTFGIIIAKITNKLVIAHMTKSEMQYSDSSFIGPFLLFLNQYFNTFLNEYFVLWLALIYSIIDIILYASGLCLQISSFLGIYIFSLAKRPPGKIYSKNTLNDSRLSSKFQDTKIEHHSLLESMSSEEDIESNTDHMNEHLIEIQSPKIGLKSDEDALEEVVCEEISSKSHLRDGKHRMIGSTPIKNDGHMMKFDEKFIGDRESVKRKLRIEQSNKNLPIIGGDFLLDSETNQKASHFLPSAQDIDKDSVISSSLSNSLKKNNMVNVSYTSDVLDESLSSIDKQSNKNSSIHLANGNISTESDDDDNDQIMFNQNLQNAFAHNRTI